MGDHLVVRTKFCQKLSEKDRFAALFRPVYETGRCVLRAASDHPIL